MVYCSLAKPLVIGTRLTVGEKNMLLGQCFVAGNLFHYGICRPLRDRHGGT